MEPRRAEGRPAYSERMVEGTLRRAGVGALLRMWVWVVRMLGGGRKSWDWSRVFSVSRG